MAALSCLVIVLFYCIYVTASSVGSAQLVRSGLSIVTHNDLYGNFTSRKASCVLIEAENTHADAIAKCTLLGSSLWSPVDSKQDLSFLGYLGLGTTSHKSQAYWIESKSSQTCQAISPNGVIKAYSCERKLPALCSNLEAESISRVSVETKDATLTGRRGSSSFSFLGIKYASVRARFEHSVYSPPSDVSALEYGPRCLQRSCASGTGFPCAEDCLSLNIWTPHLPNGKVGPGQGKAVMFYIHGGAFGSGTGRDLAFDGNALAARGDVVVVTINYRLSNLGFLALSNTSITGNFGLHDQSVALDWVHKHIEDFGGDKRRITVFGQSAGAASVRAMLASPQAQHKFQGAIMQSTPQVQGQNSYLSISEVTNRTKAVIDEVGCSSLTGKELVTCLQRADPLKLVTGTASIFPVVDGFYLTSERLALGSRATKFNIPVMLGIMHDDGSAFSSLTNNTNISAVLASGSYPADAILSSPSLFPIPTATNTTLSIFNLTSRVATDFQFRCYGQSTAWTAAKNKVFQKIYSYEFDRSFQLATYSPNPPACEAPVEPGHPLGNPDSPYYKCHSGDLYVVFGTGALARKPRDENDIPFSQYVVDSWASFARTGNPNPESAFLKSRGFTNTTLMVTRAGSWESLTVANPQLRVLDTVPRMEAFRELEQCNILKQPLGYFDVE